MNVSRLCSVQGSTADVATHQRVSDFVRPRGEKYPGRGFGPEHEWFAEQTVEALKDMCQNDIVMIAVGGALSYDWESARAVVEEFLRYASEEIPGDKREVAIVEAPDESPVDYL